MMIYLQNLLTTGLPYKGDETEYNEAIYRIHTYMHTSTNIHKYMRTYNHACIYIHAFIHTYIVHTCMYRRTMNIVGN